MKVLKLFIFLSIFGLLLSVFAHKTLAYTGNSNYLQFENALKSPDMNLESFVNNTFTSLMNTGVNQSFGCISCKEGKPLFANSSPSEFGAVGMMAYLVSMPYANKPASSVDYLADIGNRLNLTKEALAQDDTIGYGEMRPSLPIWKAFRNISYSLMAIILVFIAFMVMFRLKISPQAVVTLQSAIPSIVISLILITFSYAIVGFLLDIVWIINNLLLNIFAPMFSSLGSVFQGGSDILKGGGNVTNAWSLFTRMFNLTLLPFVLGFLTILALSILPLTLVTSATTVGGGLVFGILIVLLFAIICLLALIRTFFTLIKVYINIILSLIFAPIILLMGALPGQGKIVSGWFSSLIANLLTLPVILTMILVGSYIVCAGWSQYAPVLLFGGTGATLIFHSFSSYFTSWQAMTPVAQAQIFLSVFAGIGIILMTPKAADIIQSFFAGKPFAYGTAIGEAIGPATSLGRQGGATAYGSAARFIGPAGAGIPIGGGRNLKVPSQIGPIDTKEAYEAMVQSTEKRIASGK